MITVKLKGGMGNQMFQYAYGRHLAIKNGVDLWLDLHELNNPKPGDVKREFCLDLFDTEYIASSYPPKKSGWFKWLLNPSYRIKQSQPHDFSDKYLNVGPDAYLDGYWQSYKFLRDIEYTIRKELSLKPGPTPGCVLSMQNRILSSNSVCLNVRRGDFAGSDYHLCHDLKYYRAAMWEINVRFKDAHFFVFSDDLPWCRDAFGDMPNITVVDHTLAGSRLEYYHLLMRSCKHFIIPNSTYGWWAAWLSSSPGKTVIAPRQWYHGNRNQDIAKNLCPEGWLLL